MKHKKKDIDKGSKIIESLGEVFEEKIDEITIVDEDCSRVMENKAGGRSKCDNSKRSTHSLASSEEATGQTKIKTKKVKRQMKCKRNNSHIDKEKKIEETLGEVNEEKVDVISSVDVVCSRGMKTGGRSKGDNDKKSIHSQKSSKGGRLEEPKEAADPAKVKTKMVKKEKKQKKKKEDFHIDNERETEEIPGEADEEKVDEISLVDEDCSRGMKKWLIKYKESRPGLKILQQRIDDFITAHEEQQEQERKEREARAAEGGWTVVVHHKGRKKTTDAETGVTVGSVAQAAVVDKMGKKKSKEVPLDFYRFQRREARRNEVMMLQSKFEQDKKRIQQLRAARKFRPY